MPTWYLFVLNTTYTAYNSLSDQMTGEISQKTRISSQEALWRTGFSASAGGKSSSVLNLLRISLRLVRIGMNLGIPSLQPCFHHFVLRAL